MIRFIRSKFNERVIYMPTSGGGGSGSVGGSGGGGFSGGGFNSGGYSNNSFNDVNRYNGTYHRYYRYGRGGGSNNNPDPRKGARAILIFIVILFAMGFMTMTGFFDDDFPSDNDYDYSYNYDDDDYNDDYDVVESKKDKLDESLCKVTGKYIYNKAPDDVYLDGVEIKKSFEKFYDVTGVEPCIYVTNEFIDDLESYAYDKYVELFEDEGHLLIVLNVDDDLYYYELMIGDDAKETVLDDDACEALRSEFDAMGVTVEETSHGYDYTSAVCDALTSNMGKIMKTYDYIPKTTEPDTEPNDEPSSVPETKPNTEPSVTEPETDNSDANTNSGNSKVAVIIFVVLLVTVIIAFLVFWIYQAVQKRKNALLDDYSSDRTDTDHSLDDYDDQFKKRESKYDNFYKRK